MTDNMAGPPRLIAYFVGFNNHTSYYFPVQFVGYLVADEQAIHHRRMQVPITRHFFNSDLLLSCGSWVGPYIIHRFKGVNFSGKTR